MKQSYAVIGSGFRAFCNCLHLSQDKNNDVYMVDSAKSFGGVMNSRKVGDFYVDNGVHMFDSVPKELGDVVSEIMDRKVIDIDFVSESSFGGKITQGFSLPDLNALPPKQKETIKSELLSQKDVDLDILNIESVEDFFLQRYGPTAGKIFVDIFEKLYGISAEEIHYSAISTTSLARLKFLDDEDMLELKSKSPRLDATLAARRKSQGKLDDLVSVYPKTNKGMRGWCERAETWLKKERKVKFLLNNEIKNIRQRDKEVELELPNQVLKVNKVIWASDNYSLLSKSFNIDFYPDNYFHHVPMVFVTLITEKENIKNFTYIQNFDQEAYCSRFAASGIYSEQQNKNGFSFVTAECPTPVGSETWINYKFLHKKVWDEAKSLGVVNAKAQLIEHDTVRVPKTVKMKKMNFDKEYENFKHALNSKCSDIITPDKIPFFRREIFLQSKKMCEYLNG